MASENDSKLHIFFFPFMASGHMIPTADMAKLFATRGVRSTLLATPANAPSFRRWIEPTQNLGFDIHVITIRLPLSEVGLPEEDQNVNSLRSPEMLPRFFTAARMMEGELEKLIDEHRPDCLVADMFLPWTTAVAAKFGVPRIVFHGTSYFSLTATECMRLYRPYENVVSETEPFLIPSLPGEITITRAELPDFVKTESDFSNFYSEVKKSELTCFGVLVNSFHNLESAYADHYSQVLGRRSWGVGPVSMCNVSMDEKIERGKGSKSISFEIDYHCLKWLDSKEPDSVIYVCFGSMANFEGHQLREMAVGLENSGQQFVWVVKKDENVEDGVEKWLPKGYEERTMKKGLIIRGWAPQVAILEHKAIGSFVTHCGWNSTMEAITAGVSMVTWPVSAEQFYNEKLLTRVLGIGTPVGVKQWTKFVGDSVNTVTAEMVAEAVKRVMAGEEEGEEMRRKAMELSAMARKAIQVGGSSHCSINSLLQELICKREETRLTRV